MLNHVKSLAVRVISLLSKNRRCACCKKKVPTETAKINGLKAFCSTDHVIAWLESESGSIALKKAQKAKLQAKKKEFLTKSDHIKLAQSAFNAWVRFRDRNEPCISCGSMNNDVVRGGKRDCGHMLSRGAHPEHRFRLDNTASQCVKCNRFLNGNVANFRIGMINRWGLERIEALECDHKPRKFTIDYLKRLTAVFKKRLRVRKKLVDE